jgi:hypothetical protein
MLEELRLYPWAAAARAEGCPAAGRGTIDPRLAGPRLSTGFAEGPRLASTGAWTSIHSARARTKEVVG